MRKVAIILDLDGDEQSHHFEKYLRENLMVGRVISYSNLPDTSKLYDVSITFQSLVKGVKTAQKLRDDYIQQHN